MGFYVPTNNDVKFPKACEHCHFYDGLLCCVLDTYIHDPENKQEDCPIVPVPPHGRMIDADALDTSILQAGFSYAITRRKLRYTPGEVREKIANAPTIIPAEEGE